ncbi:MAG: hypothetical protein R3E97_23185 [Candidatus Eisenbacteria bacterium]
MPEDRVEEFSDPGPIPSHSVRPSPISGQSVEPRLDVDETAEVGLESEDSVGVPQHQGIVSGFQEAGEERDGVGGVFRNRVPREEARQLSIGVEEERSFLRTEESTRKKTRDDDGRFVRFDEAGVQDGHLALQHLRKTTDLDPTVGSELQDVVGVVEPVFPAIRTDRAIDDHTRNAAEFAYLLQVKGRATGESVLVDLAPIPSEGSAETIQ